MGRFVNPDNGAFQVALNSQIYVDKTGLLEYTNQVMDTENAFICNSRPRRFGKSITAEMLAAYYSRACDSGKMFEGLKISRSTSFSEHLNRHDVIHLDVQWCMLDAGGPQAVVGYMNGHLLAELKEAYPEAALEGEKTAYGAMSRINTETGRKFIIIIDEWDVLIRDEAANQAVQEEYINFLRGMFKGSEPKKFIRLAWLTGILPIKKLKTQSALNNFDEFTMLDSGTLAPYIGFTEEEVRRLCEEYGRDFDSVKRWYDGYLLNGLHIYNPRAVVGVMQRGSFQSYWSQTGSYESIVPLINMDFDGLKAAVVTMLSGAAVEVDVTSFQNDMVNFQDKEDVLTCLIHLGYLAYDQRSRTAFIPNEEIRQELTAATKRKKWNELLTFQQESEELLDATLNMDEEAVAEGMEKIHTEYAPAISYNSENSLSGVISIAYLGSMQYYYKPVREFPTGRGFADFVYLPRSEYAKDYPALLIELKWNQKAETAVSQIKSRNYPESLQQYVGDILLVGISYDKKDKRHRCKMERLEKQEEGGTADGTLQMVSW
ncbi:MAG TPA: ATP-binding protein [Candidatus Eisenbergiella stercorigallinarum]|uniref:ATP-binding protein n=1 Tax=Candidatus Eisenbergiella stercorigallinarum TaxID=2838557 RepID=A0A9D2R0M5_9FIRM|nr:ATP-binding protein [Candidatus Eisenbergiella stercorigallinarum]